jgi:hypothetical protein
MVSQESQLNFPYMNLLDHDFSGNYLFHHFGDIHHDISNSIFRHTEISTSAWPWPVVFTQALAGAVSAVARPAAGAELRRQCGARAEKPGVHVATARLGGRHSTPIAGWRLDDVGWFIEQPKNGTDWRGRNSSGLGVCAVLMEHLLAGGFKHVLFSIIYGIILTID